MTYDKKTRTITAKVSTLFWMFILFWVLSTYGAAFLGGLIDGFKAGARL